MLSSAVMTKVVRVLAQRAMTVLAVVRAWKEGRKEGRKRWIRIRGKSYWFLSHNRMI